MTKKLYVGNLSYNTTEEEVRTLFSEAGEISEVALIMDRFSGRSKGFAFVEMATEEAAQEAINRFNGYMMDNRQLSVAPARPQEDRGYGGGGGGRRDGGDRRYDDRRGGGGGRRRY